MNNKKEQLELVQVEYDNKLVTLMFLDEDEGVLRNVKFNKQAYDSNKNQFVDDPKKAEQVDKWCEEYFDTTFDKLEDCVGVRRDVYIYDRFCSLFEVDMVNKFPEDMVGDIFNTEIEEIEDDGLKIVVKYRYNDTLYQSKFQYGTYVNSIKKWLVEPNNKIKAYDKFENKFKVPFSEKNTLIGRDIMVEVKKAMGKYTYGEIKPLKK
ncbi:hypothetical protein HZY83_07470 [Gemella sp. GH3]|uniref:hypothetical protein n=1 Tax=unclassified Gemella TaxID=2624949 RepID=UPI0015CFAAC0|nr:MULTISPECIES: hypothetical protein [unclassified Gemella]MBF0714513.1 hypothetical protein [Gemella sp. GH3.1]NYS51465.1 hypothetical protein [Gemella sp. GH3]